MPESILQSATILIVDDQEANVRYLERALGQAGAQHVRSTTDAREVLGLVAADPPDLIVLDLMMPYLDGFAVMQQLQTVIPADSYLPILVITADISSEAKRRALTAGAKDFLTKPFDPVEVLLRIRNLLEIRFLHRQLQNRIARDIHDGPLQDLGVLLLTIERCEYEITQGAPAAALAGLQQLRDEVRETISLMRDLLHDMRPAILNTHGLAAALDDLAARVGRDADLTVTVQNRLTDPIAPARETVIFRLVQEALTNIRKHAQAQQAIIQLDRRADHLCLEVRDDGQGFAVAEQLRHAIATGHVGLAGMYERAKAAGGQLTITSHPGQGTITRCVLPWPAV
ncbi:MAG TPA: response regulator [Chloroflexia bacterium]|nr:response regulator [Chloroflexia bacterium]